MALAAQASYDNCPPTVVGGQRPQEILAKVKGLMI